METTLKKRVLTAVIGIPCIILLLLSPTLVLAAAVVIVSWVGLNEFFKAVGLFKSKILCAFGYLAAVLITAGTVFMPRTSVVLVFAYVIILFILMLMSDRKLTFTDISLHVMGLIYIPYFMSHIIYVRQLEFGAVFIWLIFLGAFMTDSCAFFTGKAIGKHKLCPNISPKKTIEGAVGGVIGCGLSFILFGFIVNTFLSGFLNGIQLDYLRLFILGLVVAVISEIGDLVASMIKRQFDIKDFGKILPGHGGILDRCDSIILVAPTVFLFIYNFGIVI